MNKRWAADAATVGVVVLAFLSFSCQAPANDHARELSSATFAVTIPPRGLSSTLDLAGWNVEWFGDSNNGPSNNALQLANVRDVVMGSDFDIWALQEVVSQSQFDNLEAQLPGYTGFTAMESTVSAGASYYGASEQKPAILYKSSVATLQSAKLILTQNDADFAGRPPLEVRLRVTVGSLVDDLVVIVVHLKAFDDAASWQRRKNASLALKAYLDSSHPNANVAVIGDFNDDLDVSITPGKPSPFANFASDSGRYTFTSMELTNAGIATTVSYPDAVDHHLFSNELFARYVNESVDVYRVDEFIPSYGTTTSDHYPVESHFAWGSGGGGTATVIINEVLANETGSNTAGEFVELVNTGSVAANLSGVTLRDASAVRHTFPQGTSLLPGKAVVVFASASAIPVGTGNAVAASTGSLSLANSGDSVSLRSPASDVLDTLSYGTSLAGSDGVSMNRNPDANGSGTFVLHTALASAGSSAGRRASGVSF